jgi:hypothetical protein
MVNNNQSVFNAAVDGIYIIYLYTSTAANSWLVNAERSINKNFGVKKKPVKTPGPCMKKLRTSHPITQIVAKSHAENKPSTSQPRMNS